MADFDSSLPIRTETNGDVVGKIVDGTVTSQYLTVNADGSVNITDNGASLTVDATNLDIRDLSSAQDSVEVLQSTHDDLNANANLQVGNVDVANGNPVPVSDAGGSITVDASDLDIRDLTHVSDSVKIGDGTDLLAVNTDGSINVVVANDVQGTEVCNYQTSAAVAGGANVDFDYTVTGSTTLIINKVHASGSGKIKAELKIETAAGAGTYNTKFVGFNSASDPNIVFDVDRYLKQVSAAKVRITITNRDNQAQDVYATLTGSES